MSKLKKDEKELLESVEGGAYLARYSFLGFGDVTEFRLDDDGMRLNGETHALPGSTAELLDTLRDLLATTPELAPVVDGFARLGRQRLHLVE